MTGIGSLPHTRPADAVRDVLASCPELPFWPQLPRRSPQEDMYRQFSAGLPGLEDVETGGRGWRRGPETEARLERVYRDFVALSGETGDPSDAWGLSAAEAAGLDALVRFLQGGSGTGRRVVGIKGQVTGPVSLGLAVTDDRGRALLYEEDLMDGVVRGLALRARWQERVLARCLGGGDALHRVLVSVDEPYLGTFGSAFFPYRPETVRAYFEVFAATLEGTWGVHCCSNTDWGFLLELPVRFVSFDAHAYGARLLLYPEAVRRFVERGGLVAWGVVPTTSPDLAETSAVELTRRLLDLIGALVGRGVPEGRLVRQSLVTPACGLAGLSRDEAGRALSLARAVSEAARAELGLIRHL